MFDKLNYDPKFNASLKALAKSEKVTRAELLDLSRSVLEAIHATQDIAYVNRVLDVLTPMNKRTAVLFFKEFSGFQCDEGVFTRKDKKNYEKASAAAVAFLEDPLNNIWSWAERNVAIEPKKFALEDVTKWMERTIKKAGDEGVSQADVLRAIFKAGVDAEALAAIMGELAPQ